VASYTEADVDKTNVFEGYGLEFKAANEITLLEGQDAFGQGLWRVLRNSEERLKVYLNFGENMPFDVLTKAGNFVSKAEGSITLEYTNEANSTNTLVLEK